MSCKVINGGRRSGKTLRLIVFSHLQRSPILVPNRFRADHVLKMAKSLGLDIPKPITVYDYFNRGYKHGLRKLCIDDVEDVFREIFYGVDIAAVTANMTDWDIFGIEDLKRSEEQAAFFMDNCLFDVEKEKEE